MIIGLDWLSTKDTEEKVIVLDSSPWNFVLDMNYFVVERILLGGIVG